MFWQQKTGKSHPSGGKANLSSAKLLAQQAMAKGWLNGKKLPQSRS